MNKKISWSLIISPEIMTEYTGVKLRDYFTDPRATMKVQLENEKIFNQLYGLPVGRHVSPEATSYFIPSLLGAEIEFPEDNPPEIRTRRLRCIEEAKELKLPENIRTAGRMAKIIEHHEYMKEAAEGTDITVGLGFGGMQGPFTTAVILRGIDFFTDIILYPEESKALLELCADVNIAVLSFWKETTGKDINFLWFGDDYSGLISPELYGEFSYPYIKKIYDYAEKPYMMLHCETLKKGHLKYLDMMGVNFFDPGNNEELSVKDIVGATNVKFSYNLFTVKDMLYGTPESITNKYMQCVADGAPAMTAEICRKTPKENIRTYIDIAKKYEV